jgi:uncharacterized membrane protein
MARKVFKVKKDLVGPTAPLAAQQGVYNLFLAIGALFSVITNDKVGKIMWPVSDVIY